MADLIRVIDQYGRLHRIARSDWENQDRRQLPLYSPTGIKYQHMQAHRRPKGGITILRDNVGMVFPD